MPPRKKPSSSNEKKERDRIKRAIKRGDVEKPEDPHPNRKRRGVKSALANSDNQEAIDRAKKLQSAFIRPTKEYLVSTREVASNVPLIRPIAPEKTIYDPAEFSIGVVPEPSSQPLSCPERPKWRYDMSKKEVEANEEGLYQKWLEATDARLAPPAAPSSVTTSDQPEDPAIAAPPASPTYFERNLEVWRQLCDSILLLDMVH